LNAQIRPDHCTDQIPAELVQAGGKTLRSEIHKRINSVWNKEELPEQWKESVVEHIYKRAIKLLNLIRNITRPITG
jgi:flagellar basal body-associated protein FliL